LAIDNNIPVFYNIEDLHQYFKIMDDAFHDAFEKLQENLHKEKV